MRHVGCVGKLKLHTNFSPENIKGRGHFVALSRNDTIILKWILVKECAQVVVDRIKFTKNGVKFWTFVKTAMDRPVL
jgi:hypothetical protein